MENQEWIFFGVRFRAMVFAVAVFLIEAGSHANAEGERPTRSKPNERASAGRLVTGDAEILSSAVAGTPDLRFFVTPREPLPGTLPELAYPVGYSINGQVLTVPSGGFTSAWIIQVEGWDTNPDTPPFILMRTFQAKVDAGSFLGANASPSNPGCDLEYPSPHVACQKRCSGGPNNGNACSSSSVCAGSPCVDPCPALLGEPGTRCGNPTPNICDWGWQNTTRADWIFAESGFSAIAAVNQNSPSGPVFAGTTDPGTEVRDEGLRYYAGTLSLPIPECARGTYTFNIVQSSTDSFLLDQGQPPNNIPIVQFIAGQLKIPVGSCCTDLGPGGSCQDGLRSAECDDLAAGQPHVWREDVACETACPLCENEPCVARITSSEPAPCTIDARYPHDPLDPAIRLGFQSFILDFNFDPGPLTTGDFTLTTVPAGPGGSTISSVTQAGAEVTVHLNRAIPASRWTCLTLLDTQQKLCVGALAADSDSNRTSQTNDVLELLDHLDGSQILEIWQCDIDRSGRCAPLDVLASIDLLTGAGLFTPSLSATLTTCPTVGIP